MRQLSIVTAIMVGGCGFREMCVDDSLVFVRGAPNGLVRDTLMDVQEWRSEERQQKSQACLQCRCPPHDF